MLGFRVYGLTSAVIFDLRFQPLNPKPWHPIRGFMPFGCSVAGGLAVFMTKTLCESCSCQRLLHFISPKRMPEPAHGA